MVLKLLYADLKTIPMNYTSVAYPTDEMHLSDWFKELPFDEEGMEEALLDKKIPKCFRCYRLGLKSRKR